ncbi:hypothetical protein PSE_5026 [Pseudovibrio sp. FO-BEG1]|nr:hypothetical protein PSE_5026 [Pseudovibrio sp. FO-BEG1]
MEVIILFGERLKQFYKIITASFIEKHFKRAVAPY